MSYEPPPTLKVLGLECTIDRVHNNGSSICWRYGDRTTADLCTVTRFDDGVWELLWTTQVRQQAVASLKLQVVADSFELACTDLLVAVRALSERLEQKQLLRSADTDRWRSLAFYLADCHAGTRDTLKGVESTSRSNLMRLDSICATALRALTTGASEIRDRPEETILERLASHIKTD
jgi:hypothetical protein